MSLSPCAFNLALSMTTKSDAFGVFMGLRSEQKASEVENLMAAFDWLPEPDHGDYSSERPINSSRFIKTFSRESAFARAIFLFPSAPLPLRGKLAFQTTFRGFYSSDSARLLIQPFVQLRNKVHPLVQDCQDECWAIILRQTENIVMPGNGKKISLGTLRENIGWCRQLAETYLSED